MSIVNLTLVANPFVVNGAWTVEQFHQALVASISAATTTDDVIIGKDGGSTPATDVGPWLNGTTWYAWNGTSYVPATLQIGDATNQITLSGTPTADRTIVFPDKDGIVALTSDIYTGRGTTVVSGATPNLDWSLTSSFALSLTANTVITQSNSMPGQVIQIAVYNPAAWTSTWTGVNWPSGTPPATITATKTGVYELKNVAGVIYGRTIGEY